jgi:peptidyl-prolyl cis-trans isomerase A (cyclophilin A)/peptidyl-prolyl cis-trans isomerase B (cyclophilin B)
MAGIDMGLGILCMLVLKHLEDVVDAIAGVEVRSMGPYQDVPVTPIRILTARLLNPDVWTTLPEPLQAPAYEMPVPLK